MLPTGEASKKIAVRQRKKPKYPERNVEGTKGERNRDGSFEIKNHLSKLADLGGTLGDCQGILERFALRVPETTGQNLVNNGGRVGDPATAKNSRVASDP